jgi:hypothetical protein
MRRRLDLAAALVASPRILFLDEPTTGLDLRGRIALWQVVEQLAREGTTVLLTTQYLEEAERLADRIVVIDAGQVIAEGTAEQLKAGVGGDVLEVLVPNQEALEAVRRLLEPPEGDQERPVGTAETVRVTMAGSGGHVTLDAVRQLDAAGIEISELSLRRPTLDDVFLALTGRSADEEEETAGAVDILPDEENATLRSTRGRHRKHARRDRGDTGTRRPAERGPHEFGGPACSRLPKMVRVAGFGCFGHDPPEPAPLPPGAAAAGVRDHAAGDAGPAPRPRVRRGHHHPRRRTSTT